MARIGIYGGTFNPPHIGHMEAARQAAELLRLDKLLLIPDRITPHKQIPDGSPSPEQRLQMLQIAVAGESKLEVTDMELRREGPSYTYQTVLQLKEQYPLDELIFIMGTDMFLSFDTWKNPDIILSNASLAVLYRGEKDEIDSVAQKKQQMQSAGRRVYLVENQVLPISSTDLRRMLVFDCAEPYLPAGVADYICKNGLYGCAADCKQLSMEKLETVVTTLLKPNRISHVLGCRDTAVELAGRWGADETDAARAALLHDVTKALPPRLQLTLCEEYGIMLDAFSRKNPKTLHALTGSLVADRIFGENDAVVNAIRHHTTGKADMNLLEKIIYVADYMEPNRNFPGVERLRSLAFSNIDEALKLGLEMTLALLKKQGREISPESQEALNWLTRKEITIC
ncbi:MAG: nicotinate (nicotinamide) nucleotide adenylyltransferase [Oscillospiraceae bacterium]|nr:nicotinate (nicotinamide) nucleotide adenylyltransferase [Oscillospiraceae bacterium]